MWSNPGQCSATISTTASTPLTVMVTGCLTHSMVSSNSIRSEDLELGWCVCGVVVCVGVWGGELRHESRWQVVPQGWYRTWLGV